MFTLDNLSKTHGGKNEWEKDVFCADQAEHEATIIATIKKKLEFGPVILMQKEKLKEGTKLAFIEAALSNDCKIIYLTDENIKYAN